MIKLNHSEQSTKRAVHEKPTDTQHVVQTISVKKAWLKEKKNQTYLLAPLVALLGLFLIQTPAAWLTLTIAGLAMGMMIFIMTSGFTLVFGLMDVLNFGHSIFITLGAFVGFSVMRMMPQWMQSESLFDNLIPFVIALLAAMIVVGVVAVIFERILVKRVYGNHLMQILITMGGMIILEQFITVLWGPEEFLMSKPFTMQGGINFGDFNVEKFRLLMIVVGLLIFAGMLLTFNKTKIGLIIRAGVENREMVESFGYNIRLLFISVFVVGSAFAAVGGVMWGLFEGILNVRIGSHVMITIFIVAIIGGLGSVEGCFVAALLVGLMSNYVGYLAPAFSAFSTIGLMVVILMWRPEGLLPLKKET